MKVAIVTVNYNGKLDTLELLESLKKLNTSDVESRVIVVDNGSEDGLVSELVKNHPEIDVLQNGVNKGFAGGFNRGIDYAYIWGADYLLIINNDTAVKDADLLNKLIETAQTGSEIGLVSPKIYFAPGFEFYKNKYSKKDLGHVLWYAGGRFDWNNIKATHRGIDEVDEGKYNKVEEVDFASGASLLIKRELIENVGLFDEKLFAYLEDVDFLKRAKAKGFKIFYNGKVAIYHKVSQTTGIGSPATDYYHSRNRLILGFRYGKLRTKFALLREAFRIFLIGRPAQRRGILDFYLGERGGAKLRHLEGGLDSHLRVEYPLKLSIGVVNYNTADLTKKLLQSIFRKDSGFDDKNMEVIVLDNGSKDNCKEVIKEFKIKFLQNKKNEGFSKGYNKLIRCSKGEYFLMLNSDIKVLKGSISELVKWADEFKGEAVLGGRLYFPDGSDQDSIFHFPTLWGAFKEYFLAQGGSYFMYRPKSKKPVRVEGMVMACILIPSNIINKVGYLDEGTFIFFEDIEYARRLKEHKTPLYFIPTAKFIHHHGGATKRIGTSKANALLQKGAQYYHGKLYYFLLSWVLKVGQKLGRVKTPVSRWTSNL